jgi:hypothetical protein
MVVLQAAVDPEAAAPVDVDLVVAVDCSDTTAADAPTNSIRAIRASVR